MCRSEERQQEMIEDKATERWKERMKKLGLIVNAGVDTPKPKDQAKQPAAKKSMRGKVKTRRLKMFS